MHAVTVEEDLAVHHLSPFTLASYPETVEGKSLPFLADDFPRRPFADRLRAARLGG